MSIVSYYKIGSKWFLDLPDQAEKADFDDLEKIGSFHDFLNLIAGESGFLRFQMALERFDGADPLTLTGSSGNGSGGYYYIDALAGRKIDMELWFDAMLYKRWTELPTCIYIKLLDQDLSDNS